MYKSAGKCRPKSILKMLPCILYPQNLRYFLKVYCTALVICTARYCHSAPYVTRVDYDHTEGHAKNVWMRLNSPKLWSCAYQNAFGYANDMLIFHGGSH